MPGTTAGVDATWNPDWLLAELSEYYAKDLEGSVRYPLAREGVSAPGRPLFLAHAMQRVINIVGLTAVRLAFFMGYG